MTASGDAEIVELPDGRRIALAGVMQPYPPEVRHQVGPDIWRQLAGAVSHLQVAERHRADGRTREALQCAERARQLLAAIGEAPEVADTDRRRLVDWVERTIAALEHRV